MLHFQKKLALYLLEKFLHDKGQVLFKEKIDDFVTEASPIKKNVGDKHL